VPSPSGLYYEDFGIGDVIDTVARTVTETDVVMFAGLTGDSSPIHTDAESARKGPFGERVAHGPLGLAMAIGLINRLGQMDGTALAMLGIQDWRFKGPLRFGDTIHARVTIDDMRETSKPGRGIVTRRVEVVNQHDEAIQEGRLLALLRMRP
jgi:acyl dehydratase